MWRPRQLPSAGWLHAGAWTLATGAATALSWFGVHTVLTDTTYDQPRALPVSDRPGGQVTPRASSTHRPKPRPSTAPSASASPTPSDPTTRKQRTTAPEPDPGKHDSDPTEPATGQIRGVTVRGGRAVFDLGGDEGSLVSATPEPGWRMQVWQAPGYIRVTFTDGATSASVFCRWDNSKPRLETYNA